MKKQILSEEFIRMQELAGIQSVNKEKNLVLEGMKIFSKIFPSELLTEEKIGTEELTPELIAFYKLLAKTYDVLDPEGDDIVSNALRYAVKNPEETKQEIENLKNTENSNIEEAEGDETPPSKTSIMGKLRKYFMDNKVGKATRNAVLGLIASVIMLPAIYNAVKILSPKDVQTTVQTINVDSKLDADTGNVAYPAAEDAKTDAGGVGVELNDHSLVIPFDLAKGDNAGLKDPKILKNFINTLKAKYSDPSLSGKITIKLTGYASNDDGAESDKSSTSDKPLSEERPETIKNQIPKKIGNVDIDVEIEQGDYNDLDKENPNSDNHTKGAVVKADIVKADLKQTKSSSKEIPIELLNTFQPLYDPKPKGGNKVRRPKPKTKGETGGTSEDQVQDYLKYFPNLNRNGQLAVVLAVASPKTNIYKQLKLDKVKSFTDNELNAITDPNAKKIADLIINIRKNPNTLLKKISTASGIQLAPRAKAIQTKPGQKYQASTPIQKTIAEVFSLVESLNEALVDNIFDELGISDSDIKKNRVPLLALVGSMYSNEGNNTISILDPKDLTPEEQDNLKGLGFSPQGAKGEYVFLQKGQTKNQAKKDPTFDKKQDQIQTRPDVIRVDDFIDSNPTLKKKLNNINNEKELADIIQVFIKQMAEKQPSKFGKPEQQAKLIQNTLNRLNPTIKEVEAAGVKDTNTPTTQPDANAIEKIVKNSATWQNLFKNINDLEEATQLLLRILGKYTDPIVQIPTKVRNSLKNVYKNIKP